MKLTVLVSITFFALLLPTINAQDTSPQLGVVIQNVEESADKSLTTVRLANVSDKEVTAFSISTTRTPPSGFGSSTYDLLGEYLSTGKAFSPNTTYDATIACAIGTTLVVDVVIYADGTAQVQDQKRYKHILDLRKVHFQALQKVDEAIEKVLAGPATERPTAGVIEQLKALLDEEEKKADMETNGKLQGNASPSEHELVNQIRNLTRYVNRNEEAPLDEMLQRNKSEIAKLAPHVQVAN